jgi:hypothetical protein
MLQTKIVNQLSANEDPLRTPDRTHGLCEARLAGLEEHLDLASSGDIAAT